MGITHAYAGEPTLGARIVWLREQRGIGQAELARMIGYKTPVSLWRIENGETQAPALDVLEAIARVLRCSVAWLRHGTPEQETTVDPAWLAAVNEYVASPLAHDLPEDLRGLLEAVPHQALLLSATVSDVHAARELLERGYRRRLSDSAQPPRKGRK